MDDCLEHKRIETIRNLQLKYGKPAYGRNRATFFSKKVVIKVPINPSGDNDNVWEARSYKTESYYTRTRLVEINGLYCAMAEKIDRINPYSDEHRKSMPEWVNWIDCGQVGYDRKGRLKAYDFGIN